ncbi:Telomerase reverse transcriptase [Coemansia sp. RSA 1933]|nr:Telomerase reverse transcriptase [Coemansia sp. RSA 1933]
MVELAKHRWAVLLDRTGTGAMMYLLQKTSIFVLLCNNSYSQICGVPLVKMDAPPPDRIRVPVISSILSPEPQRKKRRRGVQSSAHITVQAKRPKAWSADAPSHSSPSDANVSNDLADAASENVPEATASNKRLRPGDIVIDRGRMLYSTPRLAQHKVRWDLPPDFPLSACKTADELVKQMLVMMPDTTAEPPQALRTLCGRMLKLYKKFQFRFHLFKKCPAPWQVKGSGFNAATFTATFSDSPFDSDDEELGTDRSDGRMPFRNKNLETAESHTASGSPDDNVSQQQQQQQQPASPSYEQATGLQNTQGERCSRHSDNGGVQTSVVDMSNTHSQVFAFLQLCIRRVVPHGLVGGRGNHRQLYKAVRDLVRLGRHDSLLLGRVMQGFKVGEAAVWLDPRDGNAADMLACVVHWVVSQFALLIVRSFFYATEASLHGNRLFYFRNDVWSTITRDAWRSLVPDMFVPKPLSQALQEGKGWQRFGYSRMRLMPKKTGFRIIANLGQSFVMKQALRTTAGSSTRNHSHKEINIPSANKVLSNALAALNCIRKSNPELFGSAVFGFADIHARLDRFKQARIRPQGRLLDPAGVFIAKVDIRRAFDTIPQQKLLDLLQDQLPDEEYAVSKYWTVSPSFGRYRKAFLKHAVPSSKAETFDRLAHSLSKDAKQLVFGDLSETEFIDTRTICSLVEEHITQNTIKTALGLLRQKRGIPQGSVLSSHLCSFLYGQMEREHLRGIIDTEKTVVLRIVDDFLVISTERAQAEAFLDVMYRGVPGYGCEINKSKTLANFDYSVAGRTVQRAPHGRLFPWCGMLVDARTLDVYADYARQANGPGIEWTVSVGASRSPGFALRQRVLASVRVRVHKLYMDSAFNSREAVLVSLFQNFVFSAKKFHVICGHMLAHRNNQAFLAGVIESAVVLVYTLLRAKCGSKDIAPEDVACLGLLAFRSVLARKQTQHAALLALLDARLSQPALSQAARRHRWVAASPLNSDVLSVAY